MAMPSGNVVISDNVQFPGGGGGAAGGGGEVLHHLRGWFPDERDGFISWLRGEFAAANAIIDSLCHHLRVVAEPGEYDGVVACIQQRRCNWNPVLHMQQYYSVAEVVYALQQVTWRRQQRFLEPVKVPGKEFRRSGSNVGGRHGQQRGEVAKEAHNSSVESHNQDVNANGSEKGESLCEKGEEIKSDDKVVLAAEDKKGSCDAHQESDSHAPETPKEKQNRTIAPKTFVRNETCDGKTVNVVDGMKLYEELLIPSEVSELVTLVNDLRSAGRRGQFQEAGHTFIVSKRPNKGHGREMIQLGFPIVDAPPEDEVATGSSKDRRIEPIPGLLQGVIERLTAMQVVNMKPDSCVIDIFNEGDHSQPHMWPYWFGRPVCVLFLTECDMTFGKVIGVEHFGNYKGSLRLSLSPGSVLVMQGRSADFSRHAIPALRKQRILVTLTKSQPKKTALGDGQRFPSSGAALTSHWVPPPSRSPNHVRAPAGPKHYGSIPATGVLPAPPARPQLPPPNGMQPIFVPSPVTPAMPFPAPVALPPASSGWPAAPPRHPAPRILVPGTGVFLPPPGSGNSSGQSLLSTTSTESLSVEMAPSLSEMDDISGKPNGDSSASPEGKADGKVQQEECNGNMDGTGDGKAVTKEEQLQSGDLKATSKPAGGSSGEK